MGKRFFPSYSSESQLRTADLYRRTLGKPSNRRMRILSLGLLAIGGLATVTSASPAFMKNFVPGLKPVALKSALLQMADQSANESCSSHTLSTTKAPLQNIFASLTADESADVTKFLHGQSELNLTANADAGRYVNPLCRGSPRLNSPLIRCADIVLAGTMSLCLWSCCNLTNLMHCLTLTARGPSLCDTQRQQSSSRPL